MNKQKIFVILPFKDEFLKLYQEIKKKFGNKYDISNAGDLDNNRNIINDIIDEIVNADIVLADLTGLNPNVFYELGVCHALNKKTVIITQDISKLPFDIRSYRVFEYSTTSWELPELFEKLGKHFDGAIKGTTNFSNPMSDYNLFFNRNNNGNDNYYVPTEFTFARDFLDVAIKSQKNMKVLSTNICNITYNLNMLEEEIQGKLYERNVYDIKEKVNQKIKEVTERVTNMAIQMIDYNDVIFEKANEIQKNFYILDESNYICKEENKLGVFSQIAYLKDLEDCINISSSCAEQIIEILNGLNTTDIELLSSCKSLNIQLTNYILVLGNVLNIIDTIIKRSDEKVKA